ncbi:MAG TPA: ABC transporter permease [Actinomycetota bacterium]|nr:ABC transporter permease [Actinomycetota bacterium]
MWRYIIRRLILVVFVLLFITLITYVLFFVMPPTDPAVLFAGKHPTPQVIAQVKKNFGLDKPFYIQYLLYVKHIVLGDQYGWPGLGFSFTTGKAVRSLILEKLAVTFALSVGASIVWLLIGVPIGIISAIKPGSIYDRLGMGFALFFVSAPVFWVGLMFLWIFWYKLHIAAGTGYYPISQYGVFTWANHMIMPWVVLALVFAAFYARMVRGNLIETMHEDYIRTARAKGISERRVIMKHGLRAALTPVVTMFGIDFGLLFGGAIITETVFNLQGIGLLSVQSVNNGDLPVIVAITLVASFAVTFMNLIVDIVYAYLDPRVRYE